MLGNLIWLAGGIALGVVFDETFRAVWAKVKAKKDEVLDRE